MITRIQIGIYILRDLEVFFYISMCFGFMISIIRPKMLFNLI